MFNRRIVTRAGVLAFFGAIAIVVGASSDSSCQNAWSQSAASSSCSGGQGGSSSAYVEWRSGRQECIVVAYCRDNAGNNVHNQFYGSTSQVRELKNCNGELKESC